MKTKKIIYTVKASLFFSIIGLPAVAQVLINKPLQFMPAMTPDGELKDVSDFSMDGLISLDGAVYISNQGGGAGTIKLGATGNTTSQGTNNIFIGTEAGKGISTVNDGEDVMIGYQSGKNTNDFSFYNVYVGSQTGINNINGDNHTFFGYQSGYNNTTGDHNTFFGYQTGYGNTAGTQNSYFGMSAGRGNTTGYYNTAIGYNSGTFANINGYYCSYVGVNADASMTGIDGVTAIGYNAKVGQSNAVVFGSSTDPIQVGINTATPRADLDVNTAGAMIIPVGDTADQPAIPVKGMIRFNNITNHLEGYNGTAWINID